jgi:hypothetical protein
MQDIWYGIYLDAVDNVQHILAHFQDMSYAPDNLKCLNWKKS